MSNRIGLPKRRFCEDCSGHRYRGDVCAGTRKVSDWVEDETGMSRTVSGGVCVRIEDREAA